MLCISRMHRASSTQFSTVLQFIQGNSFGVLFNGLLAEFPAILYKFFTSTTSDCRHRGAWLVGSHKVVRKNTHQVVTPPYGPIGDVDSPKSSQIS